MDFIVKITEARLHSFLGVRNALVVDAWPNLFEYEPKKRVRLKIAYTLF